MHSLRTILPVLAFAFFLVAHADGQTQTEWVGIVEPAGASICMAESHRIFDPCGFVVEVMMSSTLDLDESILEARLTPDGTGYVLRLGGVSGELGLRDLVSLRVGASQTTPVAAEPYDEKAVALSPSGRFVAYESTETGEDEIYVRPFPDVDAGKWLVSTDGGINPTWAHSETAQA